MKGVILAGGTATRLRPLTWVTNKHLLPIYNKPMIYYPLESMVRAGIKDVLIITGPDHAGSFINLLRSGKDFGLRLSYEIQDEAGGLSQAVSLAEEFAGDNNTLVILGDNIFKFSLKKSVENFEKQGGGAKIFAKQVEYPKHYGVVELDSDGKTVLSIEEKPESPKSDLAQIGIYMYDNKAFDMIKKLKPSNRGELEITDLNNVYLKEGKLTCDSVINWWVDAGTSFDELVKANNFIADIYKKGKK